MDAFRCVFFKIQSLSLAFEYSIAHFEQWNLSMYLLHFQNNYKRHFRYKGIT
jgi:hypothetical protein